MVNHATSDASEHEALKRLRALRDGVEMRAALLALLLTPGSTRERRAWQDETRGLSSAKTLHDSIKQLGASRRLPWLEHWLSLLAKAPMNDRQAVAEAARRIMSADGQIRPIDRLHWLALRHRLSESVPVPSTPSAQNDMSELSLHTLREVARVTAYLSRLVPDGSIATGEAWYTATMRTWLTAALLPPCEPPDADGLVNAMSEVQTLPWMLRPVLIRCWLDTARIHSQHHRLDDSAADALRLVILLLDCPLPPELANHYVEVQT